MGVVGSGCKETDSVIWRLQFTCVCSGTVESQKLNVLQESVSTATIVLACKQMLSWPLLPFYSLSSRSFLSFEQHFGDILLT